MQSINAMRCISVLAFLFVPKALAVNCYMLQLGEFNPNIRIHFMKKVNCKAIDGSCDVHDILGISRAEFSDNVQETTNELFSHCLNELNVFQEGVGKDLKFKQMHASQKKFNDEINNILPKIKLINTGNLILNELRDAQLKYDKQLVTFSQGLEISVENIALSESEIIAAKSIYLFASTVELKYQKLESFLSENQLEARRFYPSLEPTIVEGLSRVELVSDLIFEKHIRFLEEQSDLLKKAHKSNIQKMSSKELLRYKDAITAFTKIADRVETEISPFITSTKLTARQGWKVEVDPLYNSSKLTGRKRWRTLSRYKLSLESDLSNIDAEITETKAVEQAYANKKARQAKIEASWPKRNLALIARKLGYPEGSMITNTLYNLGGPNPNIDSPMPLSFYGYLGCLSDRYSEHVFQAYEVDMSDSSKQLFIKFYDDEASDASLSLALRIGKSPFGYYVASVDERKTGYNKDGQRSAIIEQLLITCFSAIYER